MATSDQLLSVNVPGGRLRLLLGARIPRVVVPPPVGMDPRARFALGVNLSGAETSNAQFPTIEEMTYFANRGIRSFRLPLLWDLIQPTQGGALATAYMAKVSMTLAQAAGLGCTVLPDVHSYGFAYGMKLGSSGFPISAFADLWSRLSTFFKADPNTAVIRGYDLMNEWHDMDPNAGGADSTAYSRNIIATANQAAINAIRANGDTTLIYVEGDHYTGAWDWVPNNGAWAAALTDPANNLIFSVHCYLDSDSSGTNFVWASEIAKPGYAPPGTPTSVNIGPQRMANVIAWAKANNKRLHVGETGWSNDTIASGGNDDAASWNQAAYNHILNCQANAIEMDFWGAGPTFSAAYGYNPEPTAVANPGVKDFSDAGFQSTQMVVIEKFTGFTGPQPSAYRVDAPYNTVPYAPPGTTIPAFKMRYNGKLPALASFTPRALLADGSDAGGTFTATRMPAGDNGLVTFSYTPAGAYAGIGISFTNDAGLTDPAPIGCASVADLFTPLAARPTNVFGLRRLFAAYVGPAIRLQRASDAAQQDFYFNRRGDLPRQAIQDWAGSRTIPVATVYDQSLLGNNIRHIDGSAFATLTLVNGDGFPEIAHPANAQYRFSAPVHGKTQQSVLARILDVSNTGYFISQDTANAGGSYFPFRFAPSAYTNQGVTVALGREASVWHHYGATFAAGGSITAYRDGAAGVTKAAATTAMQSAGSSTTLGYFGFSTGSQWRGSWQTLVLLPIELTATQEKTFSDADAAYYATALPDALGPVSVIGEPIFAAPSGAFVPRNHKGVNISGGESGQNSTRPYGYDYIYAQTSELDYFAGKGFGVIRQPFLSNRVYPTAYGVLDGTEMGRLKAVVDAAFARNLRILLDVHQYGYVWDGRQAAGRSSITDAEGANLLVDLWTRLATRFLNYPNVVFGLMNEPNHGSAQQWHDTAARCVAAIRAAGATQKILISGGPDYSGAHDWTSTQGAIWNGFTDPNFAFEAHQYLDAGNSGHPGTVVANKGTGVLASATAWARSRGFKFHLGEFGWSANDAQASGGTPSVEGTAMMDYMAANADVWEGWTFWLGGSRAFYNNSYDTGAVPNYATTPPTDPPQMAILTGHL